MYTRDDAKRAVGDGWAVLIDELFNQLPPEAEVVDVKEKWGGLDVFVYNVPDWYQDLVHDVRIRSLLVCERCGAPGEPRRGAWVKTLCDRCYVERK